ncbi:hypothetical protein Peur_024219 [Populus x canadensis]
MVIFHLSAHQATDGQITTLQCHERGMIERQVETPGDDETVLVQYGKTRVRVKRSDMRAIKRDKKKKKQSNHSSPKFEETGMYGLLLWRSFNGFRYNRHSYLSSLQTHPRFLKLDVLVILV